MIAIRLATHIETIQECIRRTLLFHTTDVSELKSWILQSLEDLISSNLIRTENNDSYEATPSGQAIVASSMTPEDGLFVYNELRRALQAFVMDGEMHVFYTFTPVNTWGFGDIKWPILRGEIDRLDESGLRVLDFVGISPAFVNRMWDLRCVGV